MSHSTYAPAPVGVGPGAARAPEASPVLLSNDEREFARRARAPGWQAAGPLLITALFGAALAFVAAASPPTETVLRMARVEGPRGLAVASTERERIETDYQLPEQWQWPSLESAAPSDARLACDPLLRGSAC